MSEGAAVGHLSIGEVLDLLRAEYPDVTISKIRFLESRGLVEPQRTASGYRQFSGPDVERLRWILRQQRDHFLPLKVIKQMLDEGLEHPPGTSAAQPSLFDQGGSEDDAPSEPQPLSRAHPTVSGPGAAPRRAPRRRPVAASDDGSGPSSTSAPAREGRPLATPADVVAALQEDPRPAPPDAPAAAPVPTSTAPAFEAPSNGPRVVVAELLATTGLSEEHLAELESYGLVEPFEVAGEKEYPPDAVAVASIAARYLAIGVDPRHLRLFKVAADREAGFIEQLTVPVLKKRSATSRAEALERAGELAAMGAELHALLLRHSLGPSFRD